MDERTFFGMLEAVIVLAIEGKGENDFPTRYGIARKAGLGQSTVHTQIDKLIEYRLIKIVSEGKARTGLPLRTYAPTRLGVLQHLLSRISENAGKDEIARIIGGLSDHIPSIFSKWSYFRQKGVDDIALKRLTMSSKFLVYRNFPEPLQDEEISDIFAFIFLINPNSFTDEESPEKILLWYDGLAKDPDLRKLYTSYVDQMIDIVRFSLGQFEGSKIAMEERAEFPVDEFEAKIESTGKIRSNFPNLQKKSQIVSDEMMREYYFGMAKRDLREGVDKINAKYGFSFPSMTLTNIIIESGSEIPFSKLPKKFWQEIEKLSQSIGERQRQRLKELNNSDNNPTSFSNNLKKS